MKYTIDEYLPKKNDNRTILEIVPNRDVESSLLARHMDHAEIIPIWEIIPVSTQLPLPEQIVNFIDSKIKDHQKQVVIKGLTEYLSFFDIKHIKTFFITIKQEIENQKMNCIFVIFNSFLNKDKQIDNLFKNPKYENSMQIVKFSGKNSNLETFQISLLPFKFSNNMADCDGFDDLLKKLYNHEKYDYTMTVPDCYNLQKGFNENVTHITDTKDILMKIYGYNIELPDDVLEHLIKLSNVENQSIIEYLKNKIDLQNKTLILKHLLNVDDDLIWPAYIWYIKENISKESFMYHVLCKPVEKKSLLHRYVVEAALECVNLPNVIELAAERYDSLKLCNATYEPLISEFVTLSKNLPNAIKFLNCETTAEKCELLCRLKEFDLSEGIPQIYRSAFKDVGWYLSSRFDYGSKDLNQYFREYRHLKIKNTVTPDFVKMASEIVIPNQIPDRNQELSKYATDEKSALLVVDGLSAEYIPYLINLFDNMNYKTEEIKIVRANIPTSTDFNEITWKNNKIPDIKGVDNTAHDGAAKYEKTTFERNFIESLSIMNGELLTRISDYINQYSKIIITADHGTSRLAVIANNRKLINTIEIPNIPEDWKPEDWRYMKELPNIKCPEGLDRRYISSKDETYWVVKGYDRLPKSGGKKYELHGGETPEELLVPFFVISGKKATVDESKKNAPQLVEKDDFDI